MTIFIYEDVCATAAGGDSSLAASLLAEGRAMLDAVTSDLAAVSGVQVLQVATPEQFEQLARDADCTLVIAPETDGRLEQLASGVLEVGGTLLGPSPEAIRLTSDKLALARHWNANGIPTPRTWLLGDEPCHRELVFKRRDGAGSQDIFLSRPPSGQSKFIAQEYVSGFAASVAFLAGPSALVPLIPCAQRLSTDGRFQYQGGYLPIAADLAERARRIAASAVRSVPGLLGYVGVDVVLGDDGRDWAIEINPRLTTSYVGLRALAQFNIAAAMLTAALGEPLPETRWRDETIDFSPDGRCKRA